MLFQDALPMPPGATGHVNGLHIMGAVVTFIAILIFTYHVGSRWRTILPLRGLMLLSVPLVESTLALSFAIRARQGAPFDWHHWLVIGALLVQIVSGTMLFFKERKGRLHPSTLSRVEDQSVILNYLDKYPERPNGYFD